MRWLAREGGSADPTIGRRLRWERRRSNLSQEALAAALGVATRTVRRWEAGLSLPHPNQRARCSDLFGMPADMLFGPASGGPGRLDSGPPLRCPPRELPYSTVDFTGRLGETAALLALLRRGPPVGGAEQGDRVMIGTIDGMAGIGKSALAIHVAHQLADQYPDGQLYVNLRGAVCGFRPLQPIEALSRMLRSLGVCEVVRCHVWRGQTKRRDDRPRVEGQAALFSPAARVTMAAATARAWSPRVANWCR